MALWLKVVAATAAVVLIPLTPAFAHHVMGGQLPSTGWQGLLSGLGHPIIGLDHLAFVVGVGLMSHLAGRIFLLPLLYVLGTVLGCFIHIQGWNLPWSEPAIALTAAAAAATVGLRLRVSIGVLALLFGAAGLFHGYAYGENIVGAEPAPLAAYVAGFGAIQYCIAIGSGAVLGIIVGRDYLSETTALRIAGGGIALVAAFALASVAVAG